MGSMRASARALGVAAAAAVAIGGMTAPAGAAARGAAVTAGAAQAARVRVVVAGAPGGAAQVAAAVRRLGGRVERTLGVIDGVTAVLPAAAVDALRADPAVRSVALDRSGRLEGLDPALGYDVGADDGSLYNAAQVTHAKDAWTKGWTGKGVDVALVDSGVAPVQGLTSGNVVQGPDLSFESQDADLVHRDTFGHGTHMASIIAGRDAASGGATYAKSDSHQFTGIAPDARLVALKVAAADGGSDVSQVIAAIDWVTEHAHDPGFNIRVLNLSYGTDSTQSPALDPLAYAVENAWRAGIVVVVSSGNDGTSRAPLADPASDPLVIAVGAEDPVSTDSVGDDTVPSFAQRGTAARHVDVIAPGVHVLGLRVPGSSVDLANAGARVGTRFMRGSGTSQSAAVVSGLAALYLQRYPNATPDQVKKALMTNATAPSYTKQVFTGLGVPDVNKAIGAPLPSLTTATQGATGATGTGTLEGARGSSHVSDGYAALTGEVDIFGAAWDGSAWASASAAGTAWSGGGWRGSDWTTSSWSTAGSWDAGLWAGTDWSSHAWSSHAWSSHAWSGAGWDSHAWSDSAWQSNAWSSAAWSGVAWSTAGWN
jgi:serine protease AprX